jgi:hypothetical protein
MLVHRDGEKSWRPVRPGDAVPYESLLIALPRAELESADGAVGLRMPADIGKRGPLPVLESGIVLHPAKGRDLDVTLDRGILVLTNQKKEGKAKVRVRLPGVSWELTLTEPGTRVGLELYERHPPGTPNLTKGKLDDPMAEVFLLVLHGRVFVETGAQGFRMEAPPGLALAHWESDSPDVAAKRLDKLPKYAMPLSDKQDKIFKAVVAAARRLDKGPLGQTLDELLRSDETVERLVGVTAAGALDDLPRVLRGLADPKHADIRDQAVLVLRNWMGRDAGQVKRLYASMTGKSGFTPGRARTVLQLLFGFDEDQRGDPGTYALLLELLQHKNLAVRQLAHWHLVRLVPAGRDIPNDVAADAAERQRTFARWRALIPEGQLPLRPKAAPADGK